MQNTQDIRNNTPHITSHEDITITVAITNSVVMGNSEVTMRAVITRGDREPIAAGPVAAAVVRVANIRKIKRGLAPF